MTKYIYEERRIHPEEKCKQIAEKLFDFGCATPEELVQMVEDPDLEAALSDLLNGFGTANMHKILKPSSPGIQQRPHQSLVPPAYSPSPPEAALVNPPKAQAALMSPPEAALMSPPEAALVRTEPEPEPVHVPASVPDSEPDLKPVPDPVHVAG